MDNEETNMEDGTQNVKHEEINMDDGTQKVKHEETNMDDEDDMHRGNDEETGHEEATIHYDYEVDEEREDKPMAYADDSTPPVTLNAICDHMTYLKQL
ncbi:unnamed protein product [Linum trigynum]|uniref:Uncharacterized protein n=1 Tax=Linum trigynum TaxID=586398 RepID=A0AAV2FR77_9ROSI